MSEKIKKAAQKRLVQRPPGNPRYKQNTPPGMTSGAGVGASNRITALPSTMPRLPNGELQWGYGTYSPMSPDTSYRKLDTAGPLTQPQTFTVGRSLGDMLGDFLPDVPENLRNRSLREWLIG